VRRTQEALATFDASGEYWRDNGPLARAVGEAFGQDTAEYNDPEVCAALVRPGPATPPPGQTLSFVRRMVARWQEGS
jgi:hypothetical protein